jgi:hypothetical protein
MDGPQNYLGGDSDPSLRFGIAEKSVSAISGEVLVWLIANY